MTEGDALGIPSDWQCRRLRFDARTNPVKSELELPDDMEVSFVPMDAVGELGGLRLDQTRELADVYNGYTYFAEGDVCIAKITPCFENGKGAIAGGLINGVAFGTTELHVLRPSATLDVRFLFYLTIAHDFRSFGESEMLGAGGQKRVPESFLKDWMPPLPRIDVQQRIARFLDEKTARIDALIEKKQTLLDRLAEKRQALITRAVTKSLNPDVPMKPSGVEWLGDIPAHWDLLPLRRIAREVATGRTPPSVLADYFTAGDINWFTPGDFGDDLELSHSERKIVSAALDDGVAKLFPSGTVFLVAIGATLGKVAVATTPGSANQQVNAITLEGRNNSYFLAYLLHGFREEVRMTSNGNTLGILNQDGTKALMVLRPPAEEQAAIATCLLDQDDRDSIAISEIERSCRLLIDYRASLVTAAVTGQLAGLNG